MVQDVGNGLGHSAPQAVGLPNIFRRCNPSPSVRRGGPMCPPVVGTMNLSYVGNNRIHIKNPLFSYQPGWYAFARDGGNRKVFQPGGYMGPPLRRSSEMVQDVGNGLGHSAPHRQPVYQTFSVSAIPPPQCVGADLCVRPWWAL